MTADERLLTEVKWEANLSAVWTSASQSHKAEARGRLLSDRIARIEQVERLRGLLGESREMMSRLVDRAAVQHDEPIGRRWLGIMERIDAELAREGQGGR